MGQLMSFLFNVDCTGKEGASIVTVPVVDNSGPLVRSLVQAIIYEKEQYREPERAFPEYVTHFLLKEYAGTVAKDINALHEHDNEALFKRQSIETKCETRGYSLVCIKQTLLTLAARYSSAAVFSELLSHPQIDPNIADEAGDTPLHIATKLGRMDLVFLLLNDDRIDIEKKDALGGTARRLSVIQKYSDIEELIMKVSAEKPNQSSCVPHSERL
ncbi:MAG: hypothetical protein RLZ35_557 [Pseudomonadota bacterium]|jgi:hypothetical protein